jgi:hypothetical protein
VAYSSPLLASVGQFIQLEKVHFAVICSGRNAGLEWAISPIYQASHATHFPSTHSFPEHNTLARPVPFTSLQLLSYN